MSDTKLGKVMWQDLTVPNAEAVRDFYAQVVGWQVQEEDMGGYSDYSMLPPGETSPAAGICHTRASNADLPAQWLVYITVESVEKSVEKCLAHGGNVVAGPRQMGNAMFCVIQDPAGAVCALYEVGY